MIVCHCLAVSDSTIRELIDHGILDVDTIAEVCHAGTDCGKCRVVVAELVAAETPVSFAHAS